MEYGLVLFSIFAIFTGLNGEIVLKDVARTIDITSQLVRIQSTITAKNTGESNVDKIQVAYNGPDADKLAVVEALIKDVDEEDSVKLAVAEAASQSEEAKFFDVALPQPLSPDDTIKFDVVMVLIHALRPYPAAITQSEKQLVVFKGSHYIYSPYLVEEQKTIVKLPSKEVESYTKLKPFSTNDDKITFGPYKKVAALAVNALKVHFENNSPFLTVNEMSRWIEVSHWGNVAVEETYHMTHTGATLKGHFSRQDYQRTPSYAVIKSFKSALPASARDVYYRDEIGNISTSNMLPLEDSVELEIRPRFPLFGGWQTKYHIGYNVPTFEYLFNKGDNYVLKMRFIDHIYDDFIIDGLTVRVVLPEGASDITYKVPYDVVEEDREVIKTYLDTSGRPIVVLKKRNVVDNHIQDFEVHYKFKKLGLLQEPLLCVAAFYALFISVIFIVRLDFSISKDSGEESQMKVAGLFESLCSLCNSRAAMYGLFDGCMDKFKSNKDSAEFANATKKLNADYAALSSKINDLCGSISSEDQEFGEKLAQLQKKEGDRKDILEQELSMASKVVSGKLSRQQYSDNNALAKSKRARLEEEIDTLLASCS